MTTVPRVALITGASRGIGAAIAREFGRREFHVIVNYRVSADAARKVVAAIESAGGTATPIAADVTDSGQVDAMIETVMKEFGRIDVLVGNANVAQPPVVPLAELSWEVFTGKVMAELAGAFFVTQRALEVMRRQKRGHIVYISSVAADSAVPGWISHATAKSALNAFARSVAGEAGPHGISVNTIAAGAVRTEASAGIVSAAWEERIRGASIVGRMLEPDDIAAVAGTLADSAMRPVSGALISVDGGYGVMSGR
jgi:3-oxoacyl-[acyl-carrier protein] reductase